MLPRRVAARDSKDWSNYGLHRLPILQVPFTGSLFGPLSNEPIAAETRGSLVVANPSHSTNAAAVESLNYTFNQPTFPLDMSGPEYSPRA